MNIDEIHKSDSITLDSLQEKVVALEQKLKEANVVNQAMWLLLVENSKRLQVSLAAVIASVSSLLDYEIFWDGSTQHELLEIIDSSTDQVSDQVTLLSLAFLSESQTLEIRPELHSIPEILSSVVDKTNTRYPDLNLSIDLLQESSPAIVDYEYLSMALKFLFEVIADAHKSSQPIKVFTKETSSDWQIIIMGLKNEIISFISTISECFADELNNFSSIVPTNKLKLLVLCKIFLLQSIQIGTVIIDNLDGIQLSIPLGEKP